MRDKQKITLTEKEEIISTQAQVVDIFTGYFLSIVPSLCIDSLYIQINRFPQKCRSY